MQEFISLQGARAHNLKNISARIPRDQLVVITGPSGSGKSSLAFDTIYAEGQRRYVESLSAYARQFIEQLSKPDLDLIEGLSPTISIEQKITTHNPRSTVGTVTEVYDYLRLLYARLAKPGCWKCGKPIRSQSPGQIVDSMLSLPVDSRISILAPIVSERKGEYQKELTQLRQQGFVRVRADGETRDLSEPIALDKHKKHSIEVYIDRLVIKGDPGVLANRMSDSVDLALKLGDGALMLEQPGVPPVLMSTHFACVDCGISYPSPEPRTFSFNSPMGACDQCDGLGIEKTDLIPPEDKEEEKDGYIHLQQKRPCPQCKGARLRKESLHFRLQNRNISELCELPISELRTVVTNFKFTEREKMISSRMLKEIQARLSFLDEVGVGYLSLGRSAQTLSGGESQRIRLATQIGSSLVGVVYVLDEPSIGLHQKDNFKLIATLKRLRDMGNTVLVVEHDRDIMEQADWILDLGPGAGTHGGELIAQGTPSQIASHRTSLTGQYLSGRLKIESQHHRRPVDPRRMIRIKGAHLNNLKNIEVNFPLGLFICVTGVSGSGKSTLILDTLYRALVKHLFRADVGDPGLKTIEGLEHLDRVIDIDQSPIGRTPRSNPATYTGMFGPIRDLFSRLPASQVRGFSPGRFSFNVSGGRCETCEGDGVTRVKMHFLPDVFVECKTCKGKRYNQDTLTIRYKGKNIAEVLDMTAEDALPFFSAIPQIEAKLRILNEVGLGYLTLGQNATTLSGGEAQRIKLCKELSKRATGRTLYILDEPTTGLHFDDVKKLVDILQSLVNQGNTVIVIEHHLDIIQAADHLIDLGPEGGTRGGHILATGTPEQVANNPASDTGRYLKGQPL